MAASAPPAPPAPVTPAPRRRRLGPPPWRTDVAGLGAAALGLAIALLGPRLVPDTDPFGVDPYSVRLGAVSLALLSAALLARRLRPALPVLLAVAAVVLPFVLWSATPRLLELGLDLGYRSEVLGADAAYLAAAAGICALAVRRHPGPTPPGLRLWPVRGRAVLAAAGLVLLIGLVFLALPATALGRVAIPLAALRRDLPLLGPAYALQAVAQELGFRGLLLGTLERSAPPWLANAGQALLFGLAHIAVIYEGPVVTIVPVTVALGLGLGWVTQRTGSLWPAIVAHAVLEVGQGYGVLAGLYGY